MNLDNWQDAPFAFETVQDFFKSWGMYPRNEDTDDYNPEVIREGINRACYSQMLDQAKLMYGNRFETLIARCVDAVDDSYYLSSPSWKRLEKDLEVFQEQVQK